MCFIGFQSLACLGHIAGEEKLFSVQEKVAAIQEFSTSTTKKQVRSFWGFVGFLENLYITFQLLQRRRQIRHEKGDLTSVSGDNCRCEKYANSVRHNIFLF